MGTKRGVSRSITSDIGSRGKTEHLKILREKWKARSTRFRKKGVTTQSFRLILLLTRANGCGCQTAFSMVGGEVYICAFEINRDCVKNRCCSGSIPESRSQSRHWWPDSNFCLPARSAASDCLPPFHLLLFRQVASFPPKD